MMFDFGLSVGIALLITACGVFLFYYVEKLGRKKSGTETLDEMDTHMRRELIYTKITEERAYQDERWGEEFDEKNTSNDWCSYICRYATRAASFNLAPKEYRDNLIRVAALAVAAIETLDRTDVLPPRHYD